MPRTARMVIPDEQAVYHVMFRTALDEYPIGFGGKGFFAKTDQTVFKALFY